MALSHLQLLDFFILKIIFTCTHIDLENKHVLLEQNFLITSKDEHEDLKAIDFGLSNFVKPGVFHMAYW